MIRYALACVHDHQFEGWFGASADYDDQAARGLLECPVCTSREIRKQIMAPAVAGTRRSAEPAGPDPVGSGPGRTMVMEALSHIRRHVKDNFDYVGDAFAKEARAIHEGESENRGIYGEAKPEEVRALHEDGIAVAPLPKDPSELN